ncbi:MAG: ADP-ribosylglycohydrolase family protein [Magnetococcales bacterium]|nr:ADP-ribosylglycohydrolase family protein [Magnetococcales bacterium]MBF0438606.1 ADP-ribosylglycohydrolase family protein [Magnetococcales bacterium]
MYGAMIGDIIGSIYEFDNLKKKQFPLFGEGVFFTDDALCTVAVADALLTFHNPAECLRYWGAKYPDLGYGVKFRLWLQSSDMRPYNSWGNGAAMRVSPAGFLSSDVKHAMFLAEAVTVVTHNHPEGVKGAKATASAIRMAFDGYDPSSIRARITADFAYDLSQTVDEIRSWYEYNESCQGTVPQALTCALEATDYEDAIRNAISIGGDSDTVACIAGGLAEALFGLPQDILDKGKSYLPEEMILVIEQMYSKGIHAKRMSFTSSRVVTPWARCD